jgi:hypothetical protein
VYQYNVAYDCDIAYEDVCAHPNYDAIVDLTHFPSRNQFWKWAMDMPNFYGALLPMRGMQGAVYEMYRMGHDVMVTTARPATAEAQTEYWLHQHWPTRKPSIFHSDAKLEAKCDLYIDDKPSVLSEVWASQMARAIRFEHPYNKGAMGYPAKDWRMVLDIVEVLT